MNLRRAWNGWWFRLAPPHALAFVRIGLGGFLLLYWLLKLPIIPQFSSNQGLSMPLLTSNAPAWATVLFALPPAWCAYLLYAAFLLALVCLTIGFQTRVAAMVSCLLYAYEWMLSIHAFGTSFDRLFMFMLLLLAFSGAGNAFSLEMRRTHGSWWAWEPTSIFIQRLLTLQISATYLGVGWQKLWLPQWQSGEVLAVGFIGAWATPPAYWIARLNLPLWFYDLSVWAVKVFECTIPFGLWIAHWRWWFIVGGIVFHTSITILLGIWWFQILIPAYVLFFPPEQVYGWLKARSGGRIV